MAHRAQLMHLHGFDLITFKVSEESGPVDLFSGALILLDQLSLVPR